MNIIEINQIHNPLENALPTTLFLVGKYISGDENSGVVWEFQGIYDSKEKASASLSIKNNSYFISSAILNENYHILSFLLNICTKRYLNSKTS